MYICTGIHVYICICVYIHYFHVYVYAYIHFQFIHIYIPIAVLNTNSQIPIFSRVAATSAHTRTPAHTQIKFGNSGSIVEKITRR